MTPSQPPRTSTSRRATVSNGSAPPSQAASASNTAAPSAGPTSTQATSSLSAGPGTGSNTELRAQLRRERERAKERGGSEHNGNDTENSSHPHTGPRKRVSHHHLRGEVTTEQVSSSAADRTSSVPPPLPRPLPIAAVSVTTVSNSNASDRSGRLGSSNNQSSLAGIAPSTAPSAHLRPASRANSTRPEADQNDPSSRAPVPPESFDQSFGVEALQAAFSAKYYELANKCKNWERYGAKLRAQAEALEVESRLLRDLSAKQDSQIASLELEKAQLVRDVAWQIDERRACEARLASLQDILASYGRSVSRLARQPTAHDSTAQYHSAHAHHPGNFSPSAYRLDISAPSAPSSVNRTDGEGEVQPYCSSDLQFDHETSEHQDDMRPPTPVSSMTLLGDGFEHALQLRLDDVRIQQQRSASRNSSNLVARSEQQPQHSMRFNNRTHSSWTNGRSDSVADILGADEEHRNHAAFYGESHGHHPTDFASHRFEHTHQIEFPSVTSRSSLRPANSGSSMSDEASDRAAGASTLVRLAAGARAPSGAQRLRVSPLPQKASENQQRSGSYQVPVAGAPKCRSTNMSDPSGILPTSASVPNLALTATDFSDLGIGRPPLRNASALSDAVTVTGDFLQDIVEQRRQNRRTSLSQQQQAQFRAQLQRQQEQHGQGSQAATTSALNNALPTRPPSRPTSRMSNLSAGGRGGARSRAGSVHDSIPTIGDDIFSEQPRIHSRASAAPGSSSHTEVRHPLLCIDSKVSNNAANMAHGRDASSSSASSAGRYAPSSAGVPLSSKTSHQSINSMPSEREVPKPTDLATLHTTSPPSALLAPSAYPAQQQQQQPADTYDSSASHGEMVSMSNGSLPADSTSNAETDLRGAHRALYARLRSELGAEELTKFEKYVHRYDGLEIPLEGPRGLVNRVKKLLLLADPTVREDPARLRVRKHLAREFERIVRVDLD